MVVSWIAFSNNYLIKIETLKYIGLNFENILTANECSEKKKTQIKTFIKKKLALV